MKFKNVVREGRIILRYVVTWREQKTEYISRQFMIKVKTVLEGGLKSSLFH